MTVVHLKHPGVGEKQVLLLKCIYRNKNNLLFPKVVLRQVTGP